MTGTIQITIEEAWAIHDKQVSFYEEILKNKPNQLKDFQNRIQQLKK